MKTISRKGCYPIKLFLKPGRTLSFPEGTRLVTIDENDVMNPYQVDHFGLLSLAGFGKYYPESVVKDRKWIVYLR